MIFCIDVSAQRNSSAKDAFYHLKCWPTCVMMYGCPMPVAPTSSHGSWLTAWQNLDFFARAWRMPRADRLARIRELLLQFGLWDRRDETVGHWSRGMKQKLSVARAVMHRPPLIFLDEPTAGLDPVASASLREDLARLAQQEGVTIFLTTHNLAEAERLCALVGVIRRGRLLDFGTPSALRSARAAPIVRIAGRGLTDAVVDAMPSGLGVQGVERTPDGIVLQLSPVAEVAAKERVMLPVGIESALAAGSALASTTVVEITGFDDVGNPETMRKKRIKMLRTRIIDLRYEKAE